MLTNIQKHNALKISLLNTFCNIKKQNDKLKLFRPFVCGRNITQRKFLVNHVLLMITLNNLGVGGGWQMTWEVSGA